VANADAFDVGDGVVGPGDAVAKPQPEVAGSGSACVGGEVDDGLALGGPRFIAGVGVAAAAIVGARGL
jgi:hypothetical protein